MKTYWDKQITEGLVTDRFFEPSWCIRFYWNFRAKSFLECAWHHFVQRELYSKFKWRPSISKGRVNWNRTNRRNIQDILQIRVRVFCLSFFISPIARFPWAVFRIDLGSAVGPSKNRRASLNFTFAWKGSRYNPIDLDDYITIINRRGGS